MVVSAQTLAAVVLDLGAAQALATCAMHMVVTSLQSTSQAARCSRLSWWLHLWQHIILTTDLFNAMLHIIMLMEVIRPVWVPLLPQTRPFRIVYSDASAEEGRIQS